MGVAPKNHEKSACKWVVVGCIVSLVENTEHQPKVSRKHKNHENIKNLTYNAERLVNSARYGLL